MSGIFSNTLKSQKSHLHQWQPKNNGQVVLSHYTIAWKISINLFLAVDGQNRNGNNNLKKLANLLVVSIIIRKIAQK